jgi:hypothetical protein
MARAGGQRNRGSIVGRGSCPQCLMDCAAHTDYYIIGTGVKSAGGLEADHSAPSTVHSRRRDS